MNPRQPKTRTKKLYAVTIEGKRITRWRTDKIKTRGIATKTRANLCRGKHVSQGNSVGIKFLTITKRTDRESFAMIANQISK